MENVKSDKIHVFEPFPQHIYSSGSKAAYVAWASQRRKKVIKTRFVET
jgi:hypothetical protein